MLLCTHVGVYMHSALYWPVQDNTVTAVLMRDAGCHCEVGGNCVLGYYAAKSGNLLPTFRENIPVPFQVQESKKKVGRANQPTEQKNKELNYGWLVAGLLGPLTLEYGNGRLFRNAGKKLPLLAV